MRWGQDVDTTRRVFAWRPVLTLEGKWVWLEWVWRSRIGGDLGHPWRYELTPPWESNVRLLRGNDNGCSR